MASLQLPQALGGFFIAFSLTLLVRSVAGLRASMGLNAVIMIRRWVSRRHGTSVTMCREAWCWLRADVPPGAGLGIPARPGHAAPLGLPHRSLDKWFIEVIYIIPMT
jgi:hypothetical protein